MSQIKDTVAAMRGTMMDTMPGMMTCSELGYLVSSHLERKFTNAEELRVNAHLKLCADCDTHAEDF